VARLVGDREALMHALEDMREAALASGNPAVIALADRVSELKAKQRSSPLPPAGEPKLPPPPAAEPSAAPRVRERTAVSVFLRDVREPEVRAQHALHMLGQFASSGEAYLYMVNQGALHLSAALDESPPPPELEARLFTLIAIEREAVLVDLETEEGKLRRYRVLRLIDDERGDRCVAIVALREDVTSVEEVPQSLVDEIGRVLKSGGTGLTNPPSMFPSKLPEKREV
jgi:hypothetical protein